MSISKIALLGASQTLYEPEKNQTIPEMVYEAVTQALSASDISIEDVENIVTASIDLLDGLTASNVAITEVVGGVQRAETRISTDGLFAVFHAASLILSGESDLCLVCAHSKESMSDFYNFSHWTFEPLYSQPLGLDFASAAALQARLYQHRYNLREESLAEVVVRAREKASKNPWIRGIEKISQEDILASPPLVHPLRQLEAKPPCDGACAVVLASEKKASQFSRKPVWITGLAHCMDSHYLGNRDLLKGEALQIACKKALTMAGIFEPLKELDLIELSALFSYQEPLWLEMMGICGRGEGMDFFVEEGFPGRGRIAINPSGGMLGGNPYIAGGLTRLIEGLRQIRCESGPLQVEGAGRALVHGTAGPCGQAHCVMVIEGT